MARTKNPNIRGEKSNSGAVVIEDPIEDRDEEENEKEQEDEETNRGEPEKGTEKEKDLEEEEGENSKGEERQLTDSGDVTEVIQPLRMYFSPTEYMKPFKVSAKCYIQEAVFNLESLLSTDEKNWFYEHPQFHHFFHMPKNKYHKTMGMWMLLLRTACLDKKKECWFIVNGVPIRYSIKEVALISGLYCHAYPRRYKRVGSLGFSNKHFGAGNVVIYEKVKEKLLSMNSYSDDRLQMAVLYFLCSIIIGKKKTGPNAMPVETFFLKAVEDLEFCKTFPWGRLAFDENMKDIFHIMDHYRGVVNAGGSLVFPSFVTPLELLAFEAIPNLKKDFQENVKDADPECPRMCKMKFKPSAMTGFPLSEVYDSLGTTKEIQSIMAPSPSERNLLARIMEDEFEWNHEDDVVDTIVDGWVKRLFEEKKQILFEELYNQDVASRANEANPVMDNAEMAEVTVRQRKVKHGKVDPKNVKNDGFLGIKRLLEAGFKAVNEKIDAGNKELYEKIGDFDERLKSVESDLHFLRSKFEVQEYEDDKDKEDDLEVGDLAGDQEKGKEDDLEVGDLAGDQEKGKEDDLEVGDLAGDQEQGKEDELEVGDLAGDQEKGKEDDLEVGDLAGDQEKGKEDDLEVGDLAGDQEKGKEDEPSKIVEERRLATYGRKRKISGEEQEGEPSEGDGKKAKVSKKKNEAHVPVRSPIVTRNMKK